MNVELTIHFDDVDNWWAELSDVPGFTASAKSLPELRAVIEDCLPDLAQDLGEPVNVVSEVLADAEPETVALASLVVETDGETSAPVLPALSGTRVRIPTPA